MPSVASVDTAVTIGGVSAAPAPSTVVHAGTSAGASAGASVGGSAGARSANVNASSSTVMTTNAKKKRKKREATQRVSGVPASVDGGTVAFRNSRFRYATFLNETCKKIGQPKEIICPLAPHQQAALARMSHMEQGKPIKIENDHASVAAQRDMSVAQIEQESLLPDASRMLLPAKRFRYSEHAFSLDSVEARTHVGQLAIQHTSTYLDPHTSKHKHTQTRTRTQQTLPRAVQG